MEFLPFQAGLLSQSPFEKALMIPQFAAQQYLSTRKPFGFRSFGVLEIARFHSMGYLPEPEFVHRFC